MELHIPCRTLHRLLCAFLGFLYKTRAYTSNLLEKKKFVWNNSYKETELHVCLLTICNFLAQFFVKNNLVCPIVLISSALTFTMTGKSLTAFPISRQWCGGSSWAIDFTVSESTRAAFDTVSRSRSLVKLKRKMLSAWR